MCFTVELSELKSLVAMRLGVTPVPIPNTMVKTQAAESTALETVWEGRWLPEPLKKGCALRTLKTAYTNKYLNSFKKEHEEIETSRLQEKQSRKKRSKVTKVDTKSQLTLTL